MIAAELIAEASWAASLELEFELRSGRTVLSSRRHHGPLVVQRPFHPEPDGTCHVYPLHPPGGVAGGDSLTLRARARPGARVLLTTPAAQKLYRGFGRRARIEQELVVDEGARLEWLPLETIVFDGADVAAHTRVTLATGARFVGWELSCLGRPASAELFTEGQLTQRWTVERDGRPLFLERAYYPGGGEILDARWGLAGAPVTGVLICACPELDDDEGRVDALVDDLRTELRCEGLALTRLRDVLLARYLGPSVERAQTAFRHAWSRLRLGLWQSPPSPPRIWLT